MAKKEFLRRLRCRKVILLRHQDRTRGQKELPWGCEERLTLAFKFGAGGVVGGRG